MSQFWLGMADTSGGYNVWLCQPVANRVPSTVVTPDRRFPQGTTRTAQSGVTVPGTFTATPYFRNRPASADQPVDPLGISQYDFFRSRAFRVASRIGTYPVMTAAEIRLLAAEGYLRQGQVALAAGLVGSLRVSQGRLWSRVTGGIVGKVVRVPGGRGVR